MGGIIFVLGFSHYPLVYLLSVSVLRKVPREVEQAARVSGASGWRTFAKVTLPLALPGIASGGFLAFLANLDNFGIPAFLGIPAQIDVLSTYIYQQVVGTVRISKGGNLFCIAWGYGIIRHFAAVAVIKEIKTARNNCRRQKASCLSW